MAGKITTRTVEALKPGQEVYDAELRGFGVRRQRRDAVFILRKRINGKARQFSIGIYGAPWTVEKAKKEARRLLVQIESGVDLAAVRQEEKLAPTISEFADRYLKDARKGLVTYRGKRKKASTLEIDEGRITRHIIPLIGSVKVKDLTHPEVERFMRDVASGKSKADVKTGHRGRAIVKGGTGTASRVIDLLGSIMSYAVRLGLRGDNPVRGVPRLAKGSRDHVLTKAQWKSLSDALQEFETQGGNVKATGIIRLIALTGARRSEIVRLRHSEVDLDRKVIDLEDSKTGRSIRPIGAPARRALKSLLDDPLHEDWLFPDEKGEGPYQGLTKAWGSIRKLAKLPPEVTPHSLRHSFATAAGELGYSTSTIAALLGHRAANVTERYVHRRVDRAVIAAADTVSGHIEKLLAGKAEETEQKGAEVVPFPGANPEESAASA